MNDYKSFRCEDYMYFCSSSPPPGLDMHRHEYYEILYFGGGDAGYIVGDRTYYAAPGDVFVTAPGEMHCIVFNSDAVYKRQFIQISQKMMQEIPYEVRRGVTENICRGKNRIPAELVKKQRLGAYFRLINSNIGKNTPVSDFLIRTYIMQLVAMLGEISVEEIDSYSGERKIISDIKSYISRNVGTALTLDAIAAEFFMSKYYLCHMFRAKTGMTVKDYINAQKITRACELIHDGAGAVEVQKQCGFNDYSTFYRTFKKYMGISPDDYKNS